MMKKVTRLLYILVATYFISLLALYSFQRNMIYVPDRNPAFGEHEKRILSHQTFDGLTLTSFFVLPKIGQETLVVMFHGNAGNAGDRGDKIRPFIEKGYGALIMGYRGFGGNPGHPSEQAFYQDADDLMKTLIQKGYKLENIILYGESLGTGVVSKIATQYAVRGVILDAPFTSLADVAAMQYPIFPVKALIKDYYDTTGRINEIKAPILFMHGTDDQVIPVEHSQKLYQTYRGPKQLKIFDGGNHARLIDFGAGDVTVKFIEGLK